MVEVFIKAPSDIPAEGSYVLVLYGPSARPGTSEGANSHGADGKRDKVAVPLPAGTNRRASACIPVLLCVAAMT
jgi:hypothetical protein